MPDCRARVLARKRFVHELAIMVVWVSFSVGMYKYARPGSLSGWIVFSGSLAMQVTRDKVSLRP